MSHESEPKTMWVIEKLWGSKAYDKVMSYVDCGILTAKHGERIARKLEKRKVFGIFNASHSSNNNFKFDKDELAKMLETWFHTMKNEKDRKDSLFRFRTICEDIGLNS